MSSRWRVEGLLGRRSDLGPSPSWPLCHRLSCISELSGPLASNSSCSPCLEGGTTAVNADAHTAQTPRPRRPAETSPGLGPAQCAFNRPPRPLRWALEVAAPLAVPGDNPHVPCGRRPLCRPAQRQPPASLAQPASWNVSSRCVSAERRGVRLCLGALLKPRMCQQANQARSRDARGWGPDRALHWSVAVSPWCLCPPGSVAHLSHTVWAAHCLFTAAPRPLAVIAE